MTKTAYELQGLRSYTSVKMYIVQWSGLPYKIAIDYLPTGKCMPFYYKVQVALAIPQLFLMFAEIVFPCRQTEMTEVDM